MKCRALSISSKHSALNFQKFPVANETAFSGISGKEDNLVRYTQIFENFLARISVPFAFPPRISGTFG
jgi:hypothetical protein